MNNEKLNSTPKLSIAKREIFRICKDPVYFFCMLVAPTICVVFFLSLMKEGLPTDMPVAVVDLDGSSNSRNLARQLDAFEQTKVMLTTVSFEEARQAMQEGKVYGIFYIPKDFGVDATAGRQPKLSFYTNGTYLIAASLLFRDMKTMSVLAGASVGLQTGLAHGYTENQIMAQLQPIVIDTHAIGNPWLNYSVYLNNTLLPGVLQLMIFLVTVLSIGSEIKYSTAREWLQMGGNSLTVSLIGKIFPHTVIFTIVAFLYAVALYGFNSFPLNKWLVTDAVSSISAGDCFAGGRDFHDRGVADFSFRVELCLPIRDDRFFYRRIFFSGIEDGPYFAGTLQPVSSPALFSDLCRPGFERKAFLL